MGKLLKLALLNWRRQRLRTALTVGALALSMGAVVFVYSLSIAFQSSGSGLLEKVLGSADVWVVPPAGVSINRSDNQIEAKGVLSPSTINSLRAASGSGVSTNEAGWATIKSSDPKQLAEKLESAGFTVTSDPAVRSAEPGSKGLAYLVTTSTDRFAIYSFSAQFESTQVNKVTASVLGLVGRVTLILGFISVLSSLLISIEERRREFGILAAVGITDDVLYLFLVECGLIVLAGLVIGMCVGAGLFALLLPSVFSVGALFKAIALLSVYFPIMLIVGGLVPAHRLLRHSPLELLREAT